jgi:hypothetical protein
MRGHPFILRKIKRPGFLSDILASGVTAFKGDAAEVHHPRKIKTNSANGVTMPLKMPIHGARVASFSISRAVKIE